MRDDPFKEMSVWLIVAERVLQNTNQVYCQVYEEFGKNYKQQNIKTYKNVYGNE